MNWCIKILIMSFNKQNGSLHKRPSHLRSTFSSLIISSQVENQWVKIRLSSLTCFKRTVKKNKMEWRSISSSHTKFLRNPTSKLLTKNIRQTLFLKCSHIPIQPAYIQIMTKKEINLESVKTGSRASLERKKLKRYT